MKARHARKKNRVQKTRKKRYDMVIEVEEQAMCNALKKKR